MNKKPDELVHEYMLALLGNPDFIKVAAFRYGKGIEERGFNLSTDELSSAVLSLHQCLSKRFGA